MLQVVGGGRRRRWPKGTWMRLESGEILRAWMRRRRVSERTLARYAGCSRAMIGHLLHERKTTCTPQLAERIAEALDVELSSLFTPKMSAAGKQSDAATGAAA